MKRFACLFVVLILSAVSVFAADDILIADFEGKDYGDWVATGAAFGKAPARGALGGQMAVSGFKGKGLVNTYLKSDGAVGTLTSPAFKIECAAINFLIGGGGFADTTCMNLLVGGKRVLTAEGPNTQSGGSEKLAPQGWDVKKWMGKTATIQIVDAATGGWGHINVDHIVQSDSIVKAPLPKITRQREIKIDQPYLLLPVKNGGPKLRMRLIVDGETAREFDIELAEAEEDQWMFMDMVPFQGKSVVLEASNMSAESKGLDGAKQSATLPNSEGMYQEKYRPQFHFTSRRGWHNDPNGLVYYKGEWHLYYQHNPYGIKWGNMHWGHAVSPDLMHWTELPVAIYPARHGDWAFSGSGLVDWKNTGGFKTGKEDVLVAPFTSTGRGEVIYYSNDRGRTFSEHKGNPVVKHSGRDPKVIWHKGLGQWSMAVYDEFEGKRYIAFHTSPDLKTWTFQSRIEGFYECPDIFQLPVQGTDKAMWVLYGADGKYSVGEFDGKVFKPKGEKQTVWYGNFYAAQSYSDAPDNRRVQIGWGRGITFPGMPFSQQMVIPVDLTLRETEDGVRMFAEPVPEVEKLRGEKFELNNVVLRNEEIIISQISGDLFDIEATISIANVETIGLLVRGIPVLYDVQKGELSCGKLRVPLAPIDGNISLRILADRGSIEVFGNAGRVAMSLGVIPADDNRSITTITKGGKAKVQRLVIHKMKSVWDDIVAPGATLQTASREFKFTEGPAMAAEGSVLFTDQPNDRIMKWGLDGKVTTWMQPSGRSNGLYFDHDGNLIACADEKNEMWSIDKDKKSTVILKDYQGKLLNGPNDLWIRPDGGIYFTDPLYKRDYWERGPMEQDGQHVYFISPDHKTVTRVANDLKQPNGIIGSPCGKKLYVADIRARKTYSYKIAKDGSLSGKKLFCEMGSDGMTIDSEGNVYLTGKGVHVFNCKGEKIKHIEVPGEGWTANVTFGGKDHKTLVITASKGLYTLKMRVVGKGFPGATPNKK